MQTSLKRGPTWQLKTPTGHGTAFAYATVQDQFDSIHYYSSPPTTPGGSTPATSWSIDGWIGSGNNTVYNPVDFGMIPNETGAASANTAPLQNAINAAIADSNRRRFWQHTGKPPAVCSPVGTWPARHMLYGFSLHQRDGRPTFGPRVTEERRATMRVARGAKKGSSDGTRA